MKYRAVYQPKSNSDELEVVSVYPNDSNVITTTGQRFMVDDLKKLIRKLRSDGVDVSYFWKNGITAPIEPSNPSDIEVDISNHPQYPQVKRKAFVLNLGFSLEGGDEDITFTVLVRHFYNGTVINGRVNEIFPNLPNAIQNLDLSFYDIPYVDRIENDAIVINTIKSDTPLLDLMTLRITQLDNNNRFD